MLRQKSPVGRLMQAIMRDAYQDLNWAELCIDCIDFQAKSMQDCPVYEVQFLSGFLLD